MYSIPPLAILYSPSYSSSYSICLYITFHPFFFFFFFFSSLHRLFNCLNSIQISGKWSTEVNIKWLSSDVGSHHKGETNRAWQRPSNNSNGKYKMTEFACELNSKENKLYLYRYRYRSIYLPLSFALDDVIRLIDLPIVFPYLLLLFY